MMVDWVEPTREEIEAVADAIIDGAWKAKLPLGVDQIDWINEDWTPEDPSHLALMRYWQQCLSAHPDGHFTVEMVDPVSIRKILQNVMLLDIEDDGFDARYRVYWTGIAATVGRDWTGKLLSEMNRQVKSNQALFYRACYRAIFRTEKALFTHHQSLSWIDAKSWKRLIIPVFDKQGQTLARFLVCNMPVAGRQMTSEEWLRIHNSRYPDAK